MIMMKLVKALWHGRAVEGKPVHQIFRERPHCDAEENQREPIHPGQIHENQSGKWNADEVAEMPNPPPRLDGQFRYECCSAHPITSPLPARLFPTLTPLMSRFRSLYQAVARSFANFQIEGRDQLIDLRGFGSESRMNGRAS
jgi:hypothetical protein